MRKAGIFFIAAMLVLAAGGVAGAQVQDKPKSAPGSEPGKIEPTQPRPGVVLDVQKVTLRVDGKVVEAAPPGVEVDVTITLYNYGDSTARDVKAHMEPSESVRVVDADATYGDIAAGDSKDGAFAIVVPREGCPDFLGIGGEITHGGGTGPLKFEVPTACPGPRFSVYGVDFEGGDGDGVPEPGETLRANVTLINYGRDPADNVRATVKVSGKGVTSATDELTWPDIAPNRTARSRDPITVKISDDAPRQDACPGMARDDGVTVTEVPATDTGTVSPDTPVSSDGSAPNTGNASSGSGSGSSAPGSAGSGSTGSTGQEPATIEPAPPVTSTVAPEPQPAPDDTIKPEPAPEPGTPEPAPEDRWVLVQMQLAITATDYTAQQEYSNGILCALAEGGTGAPAKSGVPDRALSARDAAARSSRGSTALPIVFALLVSIAAIGARRLLAH